MLTNKYHYYTKFFFLYVTFENKHIWYDIPKLIFFFFHSILSLLNEISCTEKRCDDLIFNILHFRYATIYTMFPVFSLVLDKDVSPEIALTYPELYKELCKVCNLF